MTYVERSYSMGGESVGGSKHPAATGGHWKLPAGTAQTATWSEELGHRQSARWENERISRLAATFCWS